MDRFKGTKIVVENVHEMNVNINNNFQSDNADLTYEEIYNLSIEERSKNDYIEAISHLKMLFKMTKGNESPELISAEIAATYCEWGDYLVGNTAYDSALIKYEEAFNYELDKMARNNIHEKKGDVYQILHLPDDASKEYYLCNYQDNNCFRIIWKKGEVSQGFILFTIFERGLEFVVYALVLSVVKAVRFVGRKMKYRLK